MRKVLYLILCMIGGVLFSACSEDETPGFGSIYGIVTDSETNRPVNGASVVLSPGNLSTTTGQDGHYEFVDLEPGQYKVQVQSSGYLPNSRQIQVNAGGRATGDMTLEPEAETPNFSLSSSILDFDTRYNELVLTLTNTGNAGTLSWTISGINVAWLTVSPMQGATAMGKSSEIKVLVDRSQISADQSTSFIVNAAGGSQSVRVLVSTKGESGGDQGGDEGGDDGGETGEEDYSSAKVTSCDARVEAEIISCQRSGSSVVFTYRLTNTGMGDVNDFRIYPPSAMSVIQGGTKSSIFDDAGNEYPYPTMTLRNASTTGSNILNVQFPEDVPCKGTVTLKDVPEEVETITFIIGVYAYPNSVYNMADTKVSFKNVPVY